MFRMDLALQRASVGTSEPCPFTIPVPREGYRPEQIRTIPTHVRGLIALWYQLLHTHEFGPYKPRYEEYRAIRKISETSLLDALSCPPGTLLRFCENWTVVTDMPKCSSQ